MTMCICTVSVLSHFSPLLLPHTHIEENFFCCRKWSRVIKCNSGTVAALLHGIGAAKYDSGKVTKAKFAGSSLYEIRWYWHSYFYANVCWQTTPITTHTGGK